MQSKLPKNLILNYSDNVIDMVQFGSSVQAKKEPSDIDIAVIYKKIPVKHQLEESQKIKRQLENYFSIPIHIKSYDLYSLFEEGNFAKSSILFYGISLIFKRQFSNLFGIVPKLQISYILKNLKKKDKVRFNYLLNGRNKAYGLLREYKGKLLNPGLIEINPENEELFEKEMKKITNNIKINKIYHQLD